MTKRAIVTAGLPYSNGDLHVGHMAGCYLPADIYTRYLKMTGVDAKYVCGSDDHGVSIVLSSEQEGRTPKETVEHYHQRQKEAFEGLGIEFDIFSSTSGNPHHPQLCSDFFLNLHEKGYFSKETTEQFYDAEKEAFLPDRYVKGECGFCGAEKQNSDQCEDCGKLLDTSSLKNPYATLSGNPVSRKETTHWFLDLSKFDKEVSSWVDTAKLRDNNKKYVKSLLKSGLVKRSMTRDLEWGIKVPLDDTDALNKVLYVWFDAPIGYISNTKEMFINEGKDENEFKNWWEDKDCPITHFIGEDNTIFHCIIWIAMLKAQEKYSMPNAVVVNNFLNIKVDDQIQKISKSKKNGVWIKDYIANGNDPDFLRYYLTEISPEKQRGNFDAEEFVALCNSSLADTLGNFINRSITFSLKFMGDTLPKANLDLAGDLEKELDEKMKKCFKEVSSELDTHSTKNAIRSIFEFARFCNKYFNDKEPWATRKNDEEATKLTLFCSIRSIYFLGAILTPFMPGKAKSILAIFNADTEQLKWADVLSLPEAGAALNKPEILFQKVEEIL